MNSPADAERVSVCCAAPEHPDVPGMCGACKERTSFEPAADDDALVRRARTVDRMFREDWVRTWPDVSLACERGETA